MSPQAIEALIILAAKYGPELVVNIIAVFKKQDPTLEDFHVLFSNVKPYEAYNIPDVGPDVGPDGKPIPPAVAEAIAFVAGEPQVLPP